MSQWCSNCRSNVDVLQGKNDLTICHDCGCELAYRPIEPLKTVALFESLINFDSGLAKYPGELANAESTYGPVPDVELETQRFLPSGYFDVSARDVELDERWHADQLLERIIQLEQTFQIAENLIESSEIDEIAINALNEPNANLPTPSDVTTIHPSNQKSKRSFDEMPLVRFDPGHVATPEQIRAYNEQRARRDGAGVSGGNSVNRRVRESAEPTDDRNQFPRVRIDAGHASEIPMARPILSDDLQGTRHRIDTPVGDIETERSAWNTEARQFTCAAMGTAWIIQLLIGLAVVSNGPLAIWSLWLVAETIGTICLGRIGWQLLSRRDDIRTARSIPRPSTLGTANRDKQTARAAQRESNGI
ncbi:MAG: hypothetical protein JNK57_16590 [Planctomycetaceae bacterium]|nr:hypothetical protein [Planctomycetaceae bacterium]